MLPSHDITLNSRAQRLWDNGPRVYLIVLLAVAFAARLAVRVSFGEQYFWSNSYYFYYNLAANIVAGNGFCVRNGCALYPPLYPLFLTMSVLAGRSFWLVVAPQALLGAGTALCAYLIGKEIFNRRVGTLACAITAFYPYYLMHDTALQETGMVTFCTALAVWLLLRARKRNRYIDWFAAGVALGTVPLVRTSLSPVVAVGLFWCAIWGAPGAIFERVRKNSILALAVLLTLSPWLLYNYRVIDVPAIGPPSGSALWVGNNPDTFSHYPVGSIDRSRDEALRNMSAADRAEVAALSKNENATSNWYTHRALEFMRENPTLVLERGLRKIEAGFSWRLNPYREPLAQAAYFIGYVPIALLGILGMILARDRPGTILVTMLYLAFIVVTAIFWAHTSHRSYLDVYWIVFAASVVESIWADPTSFVKSQTIRRMLHLTDQETAPTCAP
jgi:4-amino-4-deoxy-L-arabinose transferase-like glycosyltransferase